MKKSGSGLHEGAEVSEYRMRLNSRCITVALRIPDVLIPRRVFFVDQKKSIISG
jgi:hypothetical protein